MTLFYTLVSIASSMACTYLDVLNKYMIINTETCNNGSMCKEGKD